MYYLFQFRCQETALALVNEFGAHMLRDYANYPCDVDFIREDRSELFHKMDSFGPMLATIVTMLTSWNLTNSEWDKCLQYLARKYTITPQQVGVHRRGPQNGNL